MERILNVNGRDYRWPRRPTVVVCIDGNAPEYFASAEAAGLMPNLTGWKRSGLSLISESVIPSYTNPNNISIVTGVPPYVHGISGNYFLDSSTGEETMMNDPKFLRSPTILANFAHFGARVAVVTAKDKLRLMLGSGLDVKNGRAVCFSAEKADTATEGENGISGVPKQIGMAAPEVYSAGLSEFVLAAGNMLLDVFKPDLMYLSTTDYIQHKHAPGTNTANDFYAMLDRYLGLFDKHEVAVVLTADHGMNDKVAPDGRPNVLYLQSDLDRQFPELHCRVILPITDPYVVHHGALGSYAVIYMKDRSGLQQVTDFLSRLPETEKVYVDEEAAKVFQLPRDRIGHIVILAKQDAVFGQTPDDHDLSLLETPLRSHGGVSEQQVPLVLNFTIDKNRSPARIRNYDAFSIALNRRLPLSSMK